MPKGPSAAFGVDVNTWDEATSSTVYINGKLQKTWIPMNNAILSSGQRQSLYFANDHPTHAGQFKGMVNILVEQGFDCSMLDKKLQE
jgi:hypothetical protein